MKTTILTSSITTVLTYLVIHVLSGWMMFLVIWIALGFFGAEIIIAWNGEML